jgi:hypothetical protein
MQHRFTATAFLVAGGLVVWIADFVVVYVFAALACARGFADASLLGLPIVTAATLILTLIAGVITVWIGHRGYRWHSNAKLDEHTRFIGFVTFAAGMLALVALVLLVMPALLTSACPQR